jgi:hypothetical protein
MSEEPAKTGFLTVKELLDLVSFGVIGKIEMRSTLANIYSEFSKARDADVDNSLRQIAEIQRKEQQRLEAEAERALAAEHRKWEEEMERES